MGLTPGIGATAAAELIVRPSLEIVLDIDEIQEHARDRPILEALADTGIRVVIVSGGAGSADPRLRARVVSAWGIAPGATPSREAACTWPLFATDDLDELETYLAPFAAVHGVGVERSARAVRAVARHVTGGARAEVMSELTRASDDWLASHPDHMRVGEADFIEIRRVELGARELVAWLRAGEPDARLIVIVSDRLHDDFEAVLSRGDAMLAIGAPSGASAERRGSSTAAMGLRSFRGCCRSDVVE